MLSYSGNLLLVDPANAHLFLSQPCVPSPYAVLCFHCLVHILYTRWPICNISARNRVVENLFFSSCQIVYKCKLLVFDIYSPAPIHIRRRGPWYSDTWGLCCCDDALPTRGSEDARQAETFRLNANWNGWGYKLKLNWLAGLLDKEAVAVQKRTKGGWVRKQSCVTTSFLHGKE